MTLRQRLKAGLRWSIAEKIGLTTISLIQLMVVVRFISQAEIGLMAMANTILAFVGILSEMGFGNSVLYSQEDRQSTIVALFWVYSGMGVFLAIVCFFSAPFAVFLFDEPRLEEIFRWSALSIGILGIGQLPSALLYKDLAFREISISKVIASTISFFFIATTAVKGFGAYALVFGSLVNTITSTTLVCWFGRKKFSLTKKANFRSLRGHLRFGSFQVGESLVTSISTQFDTFIIGRLLGAEALGLYDIIKRLLARPLLLINPIVTKVITPVLAVERSSQKRMKSLYLKQILFLCSTNFPIYIGLAFSAEEIIRFFLSDAFLVSRGTTIFMLFCIYFMIYTIQNPIGTLIISSGQVHRSFIYNLGISIILPLILWKAAQQNLDLVVSAMVGFQGIMIFVAQKVLLKPAAGIRSKEVIFVILKPLLISLLTFGGISIVIDFIGFGWYSFIFNFFIGGILYLMISLKWNRDYVLECKQIFIG